MNAKGKASLLSKSDQDHVLHAPMHVLYQSRPANRKSLPNV